MRKNLNTGTPTGISIFALDDDETMTSTLQSYFQSSGYKVDVENNPELAIERVRNGNYDIMLLDFLMSPICGDQVVERIRQFNRDIYIILLTGHRNMAPPIKTIRELEIQGYFEKSNHFDQLELLVESCVKSIRQVNEIRKYQDELRAANERLRENYMEIISVLRLAVDAKDFYTRGHSDRVAFYSTKIAEAMGKDAEYCELIKVAGLFHDIGKLGTADEILTKNTKLTDGEYEIIKEHPAHGEKILAAVSQLNHITAMVRGHHERYDGKGYPDGLAGEEIPEQARIVAVADSFDAMTSNRRYRDELTFDEAVNQLIEGKNTQFDGKIVDLFLKVLEDYDLLKVEIEKLGIEH